MPILCLTKHNPATVFYGRRERSSANDQLTNGGRRRNLIRLGIHPAEVYKATRSHRGYWWMAGTSIVQRALDNRWLTQRGVPSIRQQWIEMHYGQQNEQFNPVAVNLTGTA